jgi:ankyrin repeat protein
VAEELLKAAGNWKGTGADRRMELLNMKADNRKGDPDSALTFASRYGHVEVAQLLLNANIGVDYELNPNGSYTSLHRACANGHVEVAQLLLSHFSKLGKLGKYLNQKTHNDGAMTSLMLAAKNGYTHIVKMLLLITSDDLLMTTDDLLMTSDDVW